MFEYVSIMFEGSGEGSDHRNSKGQQRSRGTTGRAQGQSPSSNGHWHVRPRLSQQQPLPNSWDPAPPPTWGCTEDTAVSSTLNTPLWPSTQRMPGSATCGRDAQGGHWPAPPTPTGQAASCSPCDTLT